jgi:hypothetical protein
MLDGLRERVLKWRKAREERKREKLDAEIAKREYDRRHESNLIHDSRGGPN